MYKTVNELATELGVTRATVWNWTKKLGFRGYSDQFDGRVRLFDVTQQKRLREAILKTQRRPKGE